MKKTIVALLTLTAILAVTTTLLVNSNVAAVVPTDYRSRSQLIQDFVAFDDQYPSLVSIEKIGTSVAGRDILSFRIGPQKAQRTILINAAIHGAEPVNTELLYYVTEWLLKQQDPAARQLMQSTAFYMIPLLNIDRYPTSRTNLNNVDLNRNFEVNRTWTPYRSDWGPFALSEPETQALEEAFKKSGAYYYIDLHAGDTKTLILNYINRADVNWTWQNSFYNLYKSQCAQRNVTAAYEQAFWGTPQPVYPISAADAYYSHGIMGWSIETTILLKPAYSVIQTELLPEMIPMLIALGGYNRYY